MKKETLERLYFDEKLSMKKIAERHNISAATVHRLFHEYELKPRPKWKEPNKGLELTELQEELVYAKVLGDGYIGKSKHHRNFHFEFSHEEKQREYAKHCYMILEDWGTYSEVTRKRDPEIYKKHTWVECVFKSCNHPEFNRIHRHFYEYGRKIVNNSILEQINEFGLALWFMDDGHCERCNSGYLNTMCFTLEENKLIVEWLMKRFNLHANTVAAGKSRNGKDTLYRVRIQKRSWEDFCNIVEPHFVESLKYKLGKDIVRS